ncbi:hypothetical protein BV20DRAFT_1054803 [Pilatotrama ljubarskyi]|nr:hypothetical protein BV20DRAFT_1054803 [Pilatotrama ljubarskyi]
MQTSIAANMEEEIEETQRQIHRSAELIQSAFEGLTTLHNRVIEATSLRAQGRMPTSPSRVPVDSGSTRQRTDSRNTMDPGHDVIILSSSSPSDNSPAPNHPLAPSIESTTSSSSPRRPRTLDSSSLSDLRTEIMMSTESVRNRAGELDELRSAIVEHAQERRRQAARAPAVDTQSRTAATDAPPTAGSVALTPYAALQARYRRLLLESTARQRAESDESATSLGLMVSARTTSSPSSPSNQPSPTTSRDNANTTVRHIPSASPSTSSTPAQGPSSSSPIPTGIATRLTRLAQDIQQDISRINRQSESLMSWIDENRARLDATLASHPAGRTADSGRSPSPSASHTPRPSHANVAATNTSLIPDISDTTARTVLDDPSTRTSVSIHIGADSRLVAVSAHPTPHRRRSSDATRALRGPLRMTREPTIHADSRDGPLTRGTRVDVGSPSSSSRDVGRTAASNSQVTGSLSGDPELVDAVSRVRGALARARQSRPYTGSGEEDEEPTETRSYRVRRRLNADGDEEVLHVPVRQDSAVRERARRSETTRRNAFAISEDEEPYRGARSDAPGEPRPISRRPARRSPTPLSDDENDSVAWWGAIRRLDALSREPEPETRSDDPRRSWWNPVAASNERRNRERRQGFTTTIPSYQMTPVPGMDIEYERGVAAMRARAVALTSSDPPARTLDNASLPPPPPPVRPFSLVSTTQNNPGSLWNDSSVRVRLRAAAARLDEDMRALDAARERAQSQQQQPQSQSQQAQPPRRPPPSFWADYVHLSSPSPPLERSSDRGARGGTSTGARAQDKRADGASPEQPMWGSPTPFHPSPLPLPLVQDVNSLQARSRVFESEKKVARMPRRRALAGR